MYLKSIELIGFKSFAQKTKLEFKPGMTAIVGPNGCGKSNVSDAVRWVLGEQRAKALRGAKMEDVIFNGTDKAKPHGMAEVILTLADCGSTLGIDYNEVCISRRVFRSGESGYFLNRKACRLKDIQRLFMDTGVGTDSYSVLEQGKIDQILSARPEDRRAVFEEASGITKYKYDKKEALRKLEHTEANILRLDDVIREVKRQIISLQRQAGKARRYKELSQEIRSLDLFASNQYLSEYDANISEINSQISILEKSSHNFEHEIKKAEEEATNARKALSEREIIINETLEDVSNAKDKLNQSNQIIIFNKDRVQELEFFVERDSKECSEAKNRLNLNNQDLANMENSEEALKLEASEARKKLDNALSSQRELEEKIQNHRTTIENKRSQAIEIDSLLSKYQNDLNLIDASERENILKKERLTTEKIELEKSTNNFKARSSQLKISLLKKEEELDNKKSEYNTLKNNQSERENNLLSKQTNQNEIIQQITTLKAQLDLLIEKERRGIDTLLGNKKLLERNKSESWFTSEELIGPLVEKISIDSKWQTALEIALGNIFDSLIVKDINIARSIFKKQKSDTLGNLKLLHSQFKNITNPMEQAETSILKHIKCSDDLLPLLNHLLRNTYIVDDINSIPNPIPDDYKFITADGILFSNQSSESIVNKTNEDSIFARHQLKLQLTEKLKLQETNLSDISRTVDAMEKLISESIQPIKILEKEINTIKEDISIQQGELNAINREITLSQERVDTVLFELKDSNSDKSDGISNRNDIGEQIQDCKKKQNSIRESIQSLNKDLHTLEEDRSHKFEETTEKRLISAACIQKLDQHEDRKAPLKTRIEELNILIKERSDRIEEYKDRISDLKKESENATEQIKDKEKYVNESKNKLAQERLKRDQYLNTLTNAENNLSDQRQDFESLLKKRSIIDVKKAETVMRRENLIERLSKTYQITFDEISKEPIPEWNDSAPDREVIETRVAEIQAKLDLMGPVNLVAIEEHAENEERYAFLMKEKSDLDDAKKQLMMMIKTINNTTTELFEKTFNQVNKEFQEMFKQLFGGGSAKLVLTDDEDILEAGIEIIARPPGKKLQSISLLSGGERTMTAVALLFSLFKVKPSPFCVMDELDAALDDANINKFVSVLKSFLHLSQFVLITHSRQTISAADVIYGVTMENQGISKLVSMQFSDYENKKEAPKA